MTDTPTPHRAPADAQPSEEALRAARDNVRCDVVGCLSVCGQCMRTAMLLDRFRAAGVRGWQPIETAPQGENVIVIGGRYTQPTIVPADTEWWTSVYSPKKAIPTHWMSLPETPHDR